jgi:hypothetical protein
LLDSTERVVMVMQPGRSLGFLRQGDRLPVLEDIPLELTVEQVFGWLARKNG